MLLHLNNKDREIPQANGKNNTTKIGPIMRMASNHPSLMSILTIQDYD
jgi:hypothetical protein